MSDTEDRAENSKAAVTRFLEIFSEGNVEKTLAALTDDVTWWVSGKLEGMSGSYDKEGFGRLIGGVADVYVTPLRITPRSMVAEGNRVAVEADSFAELKDGRVYDPRCHFLFEVADDGRIALVHEYLDTKHAYDIFFAQ
jgi:ketosteroid isomerase-like protein